MRLKLRVTPRSRADAIAGIRPDGTIHVRVTAAPEDGKANEAVVKLLREVLRLPSGAVKLLAGGGSRDKWIEVEGIEEKELRHRLGI